MPDTVVLQTSFARKAISRCGHIHGRKLVRKGKTKSLKSLKNIIHKTCTKGIAKGDDICALRYIKNKKEE